jgi:hypothetical protein
MAAAYLMGFQPEEIPTFVWAWKAGLTPVNLKEIEIRGEKIDESRQNFNRPIIYPWNAICQYGPPR